MSNGKLITFEGFDRSGKSTHVALLAKRFKAQGIDCLVTHEPGGGGKMSEKLRGLLLDKNLPRSPLTASLLFAADRYEHMQEKILPTLQLGSWVLCDRFSDSTLAYQAGGDLVPAEQVHQLNQLACGNLKPDLTFLLHGSFVEEADSNSQKDYYENQQNEYQQRVEQTYRELAEAEPTRIVVIPAGSIEQIQQTIVEQINSRFGIKL